MALSICKDDIFSIIPKRNPVSSKHDYGTLLCVCGSGYYRGAAFLSVKSALRCGSGIVTLASIEKVVSSVSQGAPECTFLPLSESENGTISKNSVPLILNKAKKCSALLIGCGLAIDEDVKYVVQRVVESAECQLIIDADALNVLSENISILKSAKVSPIITPHHGEMARLCGISREEVSLNPEKIASDFACKYNCTVVLKSHKTYISSPDGKVFVNDSTGNSGLARGGSGDVLAGMISSFASQGFKAVDASKCGVYLHSLSADKCAKRLSEYSMLPSDMLTDLCDVFKEI